MPVDIGGLPCNYTALHALINGEKTKSLFSPSNEQQEKLGRILLLADAAHSIGAEYCGKKTGVWADASCFSFHAVKNLTTAEGGAIALHFPENFDANEIYAYLNMASLHGQNKDALNKFQKGGWKYDIIFPGYKCNMTDIVASIGLIELSRYENDTLKVRRKIFDKYSQFFNQYAWAKTPIYVDAERLSSYHVYMLRINNCSESQRDAIISEITANGVSVNVHFQPLPLFTAYKSLGYKMEDYPVAFANYACEISLPVFYDLNESQQMQVMQTVKNAVEKVLQL
jgi:dTDP-4-amino-4,6-dideoxygalactose transaminase